MSANNWTEMFGHKSLLTPATFTHKYTSTVKHNIAAQSSNDGVLHAILLLSWTSSIVQFEKHEHNVSAAVYAPVLR
jgi:hypothetical protein